MMDVWFAENLDKKGGKCSLNSVTCGDVRCVTLSTLVMGLFE